MPDLGIFPQNGPEGALGRKNRETLLPRLSGSATALIFWGGEGEEGGCCRIDHVKHFLTRYEGNRILSLLFRCHLATIVRGSVLVITSIALSNLFFGLVFMSVELEHDYIK